MNERINELKRQATIWCDDNIPEQFSEETGGYGGAWEDKFAELIVAECLDIVEDEDDGSADTKAIRWAMIRIKKHFGVE